MRDPDEIFYGSIADVELRGIVAALPKNAEDDADLAVSWGDAHAQKVAAATGIRTRHLAPEGLTACDLGEHAARRLLKGLAWSASSIDLLVVVTQTPDHPLPGNAPILQNRLGLREGAGAFDINSGCSGFIDGLWTAASLLSTSNATRALIVVGDTTSQFVSQTDRNTRPLFGDCVAAVGIEKQVGSGGALKIVPGIDGSGAPYLTVKDGGARHPLSTSSFGALFMDGPQVFAFTLRQIPKNVAAVLRVADWRISDVDHCFLHQANASIIRHLARKIGFSEDKVPITLSEYGNTSSASIPLAMVTALGSIPINPSGTTKLVMCGFGVGWRWSSAAWRTTSVQYLDELLIDC